MIWGKLKQRNKLELYQEISKRAKYPDTQKWNFLRKIIKLKVDFLFFHVFKVIGESWNSVGRPDIYWSRRFIQCHLKLRFSNVRQKGWVNVRSYHVYLKSLWEAPVTENSSLAPGRLLIKYRCHFFVFLPCSRTCWKHVCFLLWFWTIKGAGVCPEFEFIILIFAIFCEDQLNVFEVKLDKYEPRIRFWIFLLGEFCGKG